MTKNLQATSGKQVSRIDQLKNVMASDSVQQQFQNALKENSNLFVASLIDLYGGDTYLQKCDPGLVVMEALKAATLKLPINKSLGFAYIVPYKKQGQQIPQFQLGYKGMIQLAMRSGVYKYINADIVYEGEFKKHDKLTGGIDLSGEKTSDTVVGYFSYIETMNGFKKTMYISRENMEKHGEKYSKSYGKTYSPWRAEFDAMATKTCLRMLLSKYGLMSIDMADGMAEIPVESEQDYADNANGGIIDINANINAATGEITDYGEQQAGPPEGIDPDKVDQALADSDKNNKTVPGF